jgi:hypothetical protein
MVSVKIPTKAIKDASLIRGLRIGLKHPQKMRQLGCLETSETKYPMTQRHIPEQLINALGIVQ